MRLHDEPADFVATPVETIATRRSDAEPPSILWDVLAEDWIAAIPARSSEKTRL